VLPGSTLQAQLDTVEEELRSVEAQARQAEAEVAQTEAELRAQPGDVLRLERLRHSRQLVMILRDEKNKLRDEEKALTDERKALTDERKALIDKEKLLLERNVEPDYSEISPFYSTFLAEKLGLTSPYKQYGLYLITTSGFAYGARQLYRARLVMKAVHTTDQDTRQALLFAADAAEVQLSRATWYARRFRAKGIAAAAGAPLLWLAWRTVRHSQPVRKQQ
jgi:hypothetical protein